MKKLFLLLVVFLVGFGIVFAGTNPAEPPGDDLIAAANFTAEYGIHEGIVIQPSVLVTPVMADNSSILAVVVHDNFLATKPNIGSILGMIDTGQPITADTAADYHLRL